MPDTTPLSETEAEVLAIAAEAGYPLNRRKLQRLYRDGLCAKPRQAHVAGRPGSHTVYPSGTGQQVVLICRLRGHVKPRRALGWALWWSGAAVDRRHGRGRLREIAAWYDRLAPRIVRFIFPDDDHQLSEGAFRLFGKLRRPTTRIRHAVFRQVRKRVKPENWDMFMRLIMEIQTGQFQGWCYRDGDEEKTDKAIVTQALGFHHRTSPWRDGDIDKPLAALSRVLKHYRLSDVEANASDEEVAQARDELRTVFLIASKVAPRVEAQFGKYAFGYGAAAEWARLQDPTIQGLMLLVWLALRQTPGMQEKVKQFLAA